jgi:hypothetical protein
MVPEGKMNAAWETVRVFISSTFRDMQAERDHLVRFVFPRLREQLLSRRIHLVDVDLRWGVTSEQNVQGVCREIIDECQRFLCILGGRYGQVPPGNDHSITADEVHYGVLGRTLDDRSFAYFYFRNDDATLSMVETTPGEFRETLGSDNQNKLKSLKKAIIDAKLNLFEYPAQWDNTSKRLTDLKKFGDRVFDDLLASVEADPKLRSRFKTEMVAQIDEFTEENASMEAFIEERSKLFVLGSRKDVLEELLAHARPTGGNGYIYLTGAPGSGKSTLLARLSLDLSINCQPSTLLISHFVGASPSSTDVRHTLQRLCHELKAVCPNIKASIPDDTEELQISFLNFLRIACESLRVVIILDAVNQFDPISYSSGFHWLSEELPANTLIILSALDGLALEELRNRRSPSMEVKLEPLMADDGEAIIEEFRKRYHKKFEPEQCSKLLAKTDASTPLYLLAALEELRTLGTREEIICCIDKLPQTTHELFRWILERLENEDGFRDASGHHVGHELVSRFAALMGASRHGLSQNELANLLDSGDSNGNIAALLRLLRPYLTRRGELFYFYHDQFRAASISKYLCINADFLDSHQTLARYFETRWRNPDRHALGELPYHQTQGLMWCELEGTLCSLEFIKAKCKAGLVWDLIDDYTWLHSDSSSGISVIDKGTLLDYFRFIRSEVHVLSSDPELTFQQGINQPQDSAVYRDAKRLINRLNVPYFFWGSDLET